MIASFTATKLWPNIENVRQEAYLNNGIFCHYEIRKDALYGKPAETPVYIVNIERYHKSLLRIIFQFPRLHFHLYGHVPDLKYPKLRNYLREHFPEEFL